MADSVIHATGKTDFEDGSRIEIQSKVTDDCTIPNVNMFSLVHDQEDGVGQYPLEKFW